MKKLLLLLSASLLLVGSCWAQSKPQSLGEVARKVRAQRAKKEDTSRRVFTNDSVKQHRRQLSVVGERKTSAAQESQTAAEGEAEAAKKGAEEEQKCDEQCWRNRFAEQRRKIRTAEQEADILQREYNLARTQFYQDPNRAMREQYSNTVAGGPELQRLQQQITQKQAEIEKLKQELSGLQNELRRSGGKPGWAREQ